MPQDDDQPRKTSSEPSSQGASAEWAGASVRIRSTSRRRPWTRSIMSPSVQKGPEDSSSRSCIRPPCSSTSSPSSSSPRAPSFAKKEWRGAAMLKAPPRRYRILGEKRPIISYKAAILSRLSGSIGQTLGPIRTFRRLKLLGNQAGSAGAVPRLAELLGLPLLLISPREMEQASAARQRPDRGFQVVDPV